MAIKIFVDDSCTGCGVCKNICPKGPRVWDKYLRNDGSLIYFAKDPGSCLYCMKCAGVCPVYAIIVSIEQE